ncbi:hypothetical protein BRADI_1g77705v3 [Brachypodium distachyon]|uniref:Uncharacterized protein n=1 Tax=Brachypodium distachyon TaxID=15368 RepID=A0A2K2DVM1_BRADI|nr:hypothetical protein BRADI_1g77705v3 [Brachypodium distachyon]
MASYGISHTLIMSQIPRILRPWLNNPSFVDCSNKKS